MNPTSPAPWRQAVLAAGQCERRPLGQPKTFWKVPPSRFVARPRRRPRYEPGSNNSRQRCQEGMPAKRVGGQQQAPALPPEAPRENSMSVGTVYSSALGGGPLGGQRLARALLSTSQLGPIARRFVSRSLPALANGVPGDPAVINRTCNQPKSEISVLGEVQMAVMYRIEGSSE